ncbi:ATPase synthesis protein 25 mitochondrial [Agyrium rufum]|nr:ATPase synthesis protein 25 mitochondrial [Agyrium rufum]
MRTQIPFKTHPPRSFVSSAKLLQNSREDQDEQQQEQLVRDTTVAEEEVAAFEDAEPSKDEIPWYLQVEGPQTTETTFSERQQVPPIPTDAPPLLHTFLENISIDLGLDDLTLLDLRKLDPPPALGGNLMMLVGTARSERHLHVSADRFCRWLRTTYKMRPYADGLLGRNELKLKLRRKARRIRLLSNVGSEDGKNVDDGIRTGWVCVNVGTIEPGKEEEQAIHSEDGFVGFGGQAEGVKLVVQMLTGEKREELDLEGLWKGAIARQERREAKAAAKQKELDAVGLGKESLQNHAAKIDVGLGITTSEPIVIQPSAA